MEILDIKAQTKAMIDSLKAVCTTYGLGNASSEYKIITEIFLYKYLNDKFIYEMRKANPAWHGLTDAEVEVRLNVLTDAESELALCDIGGSTAKLMRNQYIQPGQRLRQAAWREKRRPAEDLAMAQHHPLHRGDAADS